MPHSPRLIPEMPSTLGDSKVLRNKLLGSIWFDQLVVQAIETSCRQCSKKRVEAYSGDAEIMCRVAPGLLQRMGSDWGHRLNVLMNDLNVFSGH